MVDIVLREGVRKYKIGRPYSVSKIWESRIEFPENQNWTKKIWCHIGFRKHPTNETNLDQVAWKYDMQCFLEIYKKKKIGWLVDQHEIDMDGNVKGDCNQA